jgi:hypothetical protein
VKWATRANKHLQLRCNVWRNVGDASSVHLFSSLVRYNVVWLVCGCLHNALAPWRSLTMSQTFKLGRLSVVSDSSMSANTPYIFKTWEQRLTPWLSMSGLGNTSAARLPALPCHSKRYASRYSSSCSSSSFWEWILPRRRHRGQGLLWLLMFISHP